MVKKAISIMQKSLLILTPRPDDGSYFGRWHEVLDVFKAALADLDLIIEDQPWNEAVNKPYDLVTPLVAWGYHNAPDEFLKALKALSGQNLLNPAALLAWNMDKHYLRDLNDAGIKTIPTLFVDQLTQTTLAAARLDFKQQSLVVKPVISAGSKQTLVVDADLSDGGPYGVAMIQPFMPQIITEGEWSLLFFGGEFSHAVLKTPKAGDFRSQPDYDAHLRALSPPPQALDLAHALINYLGPDQLLYARVDMVRGLDDQFYLMEIELIEPDLYLKYDDLAPLRLACAVKAAMA
jgi:hypothetical protein